MCILVINGSKIPKEDELVKILTQKYPNTKTIVKNINTKNTNVILGKENVNIYGNGYIEDKLGEYTFKISPLSFYQVNPVQAERLYDIGVEAATSNPALKENVLRQIRCFNCVVGIVFETDDNNDRTRYLINTLFDLAHQVKGYLLYPNMHLYDGEGKLVFSREGESELTEFTPIAHADLLDGDRPEETSADRERRERSVALLQTQGIPYLETLKSEVPETEVHLKSREEMMQRAATLFVVAVYSEVMLSENPDRNEALTYFNKMDEIYGIQSWLTPAEAAYISNPDPTGQECIQFVWRYENCAVLLWAAGIVEELPYPSEICDVPVIAAIFWQHKSIGDLLGQGIARSTTEILDQADLTYRYDWACVDAHIHKQEAPARLDGGIVMERHYTFNWITGANKGAAWDDIQPNT